MSTIPWKSASRSRMRLKNSSEKDTSGTMSATEVPSHKTTRMRLGLLVRSGPHFAGETLGAQNRYLREVKERSVTTASSLDKRPAKQLRGEMEDVTFSEKDGRHVRHPHCNALVIKAMIANNNVHRILVDNGSFVDILYFQAFER